MYVLTAIKITRREPPHFLKYSMIKFAILETLWNHSKKYPGTETKHPQNIQNTSKNHTKQNSTFIITNLEMRAEMVVNVPDEEGKRVE
jgi:hypothetical protein